MADRATKSLCPTTKVLSAGDGIDLRQTQSVPFHTRGGRAQLQRSRGRDHFEIRDWEDTKSQCHHVVHHETRR